MVRYIGLQCGSTRASSIIRYDRMLTDTLRRTGFAFTASRLLGALRGRGRHVSTLCSSSLASAIAFAKVALEAASSLCAFSTSARSRVYTHDTGRHVSGDKYASSWGGDSQQQGFAITGHNMMRGQQPG